MAAQGHQSDGASDGAIDGAIDRASGRRRASDESGSWAPISEQAAGCPIVHEPCPPAPAAAPYYTNNGADAAAPYYKCIGVDTLDTLLLLLMYRARTAR